MKPAQPRSTDIDPDFSAEVLEELYRYREKSQRQSFWGVLFAGVIGGHLIASARFSASCWTSLRPQPVYLSQSARIRRFGPLQPSASVVLFCGRPSDWGDAHHTTPLTATRSCGLASERLDRGRYLFAGFADFLGCGERKCCHFLSTTFPFVGIARYTQSGGSALSDSLSADEEQDQIVLSVDNLVTEFTTPNGVGRAVDGFSFSIKKGETLGIVGESGCGKSITAMSILKLIPMPPGDIRSGTAHLFGRDLIAMSDKEIRKVRGNEVAMIFQEPMTSLNPVLTVGYQIAEAVRKHMGVDRKAARARAIEMLDLVRIPEPKQRAREFPHQLSGGMRQRAMIAMAISCEPDLLIADEPTTALDVTIQAQILELIRDLQQELGTAVLLITHDLGVVAETCDRVIVMYGGRKIEEAPVEALFKQPKHPYTRGLLASVPRLSTTLIEQTPRLHEIPGVVPPITADRTGCLFAPRCDKANAQCLNVQPVLAESHPDHIVACWQPDS
jgi:peptide/nickel transport system ATP-binding protein